MMSRGAHQEVRVENVRDLVVEPLERHRKVQRTVLKMVGKADGKDFPGHVEEINGDIMLAQGCHRGSANLNGEIRKTARGPLNSGGAIVSN